MSAAAPKLNQKILAIGVHRPLSITHRVCDRVILKFNVIFFQPASHAVGLAQNYMLDPLNVVVEKFSHLPEEECITYGIHFKAVRYYGVSCASRDVATKNVLLYGTVERAHCQFATHRSN